MPDTSQLNLNPLPINFGCAWLAAWAANRVSAVQRTLHGLDRAAGALFIGFGLKLTMSDNPTP
jgi:threonine/homoserine/homoserine lactone efflux protein